MQFEDIGQQRQASKLGAFIFLGTEVMLFGGLFAALLVMRLLHPAEVVEASKRLHFVVGGVNTLILLTSSLAVAIAVTAARDGSRRSVLFLGAAALLGLGFLGVKAVEYAMEYREGLLPLFVPSPRFSGPVEHLFMNVYLVATGLHAVHVAVGVTLLAGTAVRLGVRSLPIPERAIVVEVVGLYWHLVDVIWVLLYPVLYLAR
jgi:cytochrome c oxidase subunit 3